jgi:streptogramin lyase
MGRRWLAVAALAGCAALTACTAHGPTAPPRPAGGPGSSAASQIGVPDGGLSDITAGPGGAMWFSEQDGTIGRVTPNGHVATVALVPPDSDLDGIAAGPGNTIWVTEAGDNAIAEITLGSNPPGA